MILLTFFIFVNRGSLTNRQNYSKFSVVFHWKFGNELDKICSRPWFIWTFQLNYTGFHSRGISVCCLAPLTKFSTLMRLPSYPKDFGYL